MEWRARGGGGVRDIFKYTIKACIPLKCEPPRVGALPWSRPPTQEFGVADTNMLVSQNPKPSLVDPTPSLPDPTRSLVDPKRASGIWFMLGTRGLILRCLSRDCDAFFIQRKRGFQWNMGFSSNANAVFSGIWALEFYI